MSEPRRTRNWFAPTRPDVLRLRRSGRPPAARSPTRRVPANGSLNRAASCQGVHIGRSFANWRPTRNHIRFIRLKNFPDRLLGRGISCRRNLPVGFITCLHRSRGWRMGAGSGNTTLGIRSGHVAVSKRPRPRSRSLPIKRTRCQYRHHLRAAASIFASMAPFTASSSIGSTSASSYGSLARTASARPVSVRPAAVPTIASLSMNLKPNQPSQKLSTQSF